MDTTRPDAILLLPVGIETAVTRELVNRIQEGYGLLVKREATDIYINCPSGRVSPKEPKNALDSISMVIDYIANGL